MYNRVVHGPEQSPATPPFVRQSDIIYCMCALFSTSETNNLYPVALNVAGRRCVVVGGGSVAERKVSGLLEADAHVVVISPELRSAVLRDKARDGEIIHSASPFAPELLIGAFLCVAATDNPVVNDAVFRAAQQQKVLCNLAAPAFVIQANGNEDETAGDFYTMGTVRRGDLLLAVTTGGAGPALSARIRREWDAAFGPEWEPYTRLLRELRTRVHESGRDAQTRAEALRCLAASDSVREKLAAGDEAGARTEATKKFWRNCKPKRRDWRRSSPIYCSSTRSKCARAKQRAKLWN